MSRENWKSVIGFEGLYEVSDLGRVRSLTRIVRKWDGHKTNHGKMLSPVLKVTGYLYVSLGKDGVIHQKRVHRIVLEAFIGPSQPGMIARHLDGTRGNNKLGNLCWGTYKENENDKKIHGRQAIGERNGHSKLNKNWEVIGKKAKENRHWVYDRWSRSLVLRREIRNA